MSEHTENSHKNEENNTSDANEAGRRKFLKFGVLAAGLSVVGGGLQKVFSDESKSTIPEEKVKVLTAEGKVVEVNKNAIAHPADNNLSHLTVRDGIPNRKFIMVIDLARCANARKCVEGCQKMHNLLPPIEYMKVRKMQDTPLTSPYWFPTACYHCDNPPCTKVCPVGATFKRSDGIVGIDSDRCIGCKFCMAACPYSARTFNFGRPEQVEFNESHPKCDTQENCCVTNGGAVGTVSKCDFCPTHVAEGRLPTCITACPNGTIFFGDELEDVVTNGEETFRLKKLLKDRSAYREMEELGTKPRVYFLPPVKRLFPFEDATKAYNTEE